MGRKVERFTCAVCDESCRYTDGKLLFYQLLSADYLYLTICAKCVIDRGGEVLKSVQTFIKKGTGYEKGTVRELRRV